MGKHNSDKNQIHLEIQKLLEKQRTILFDEVRGRLRQTSSHPVNGKGLPDQDLIVQFLDHEKNHFLQLEGALNRLNEGKFGICESCHGEINYRRLKARPVTRLCMECQIYEESGKGKGLTHDEIHTDGVISEPFLGRGCRPPAS